MWKYSMIHKVDSKLEFRNGSTMTVRWDVTFGDPDRLSGTSGQLYRNEIEGVFQDRIHDVIEDFFISAIRYILSQGIPFNDPIASRILDSRCHAYMTDYVRDNGRTDMGITHMESHISEDISTDITYIDLYVTTRNNNLPLSIRLPMTNEFISNLSSMRYRDIDSVTMDSDTVVTPASIVVGPVTSIGTRGRRIRYEDEWNVETISAPTIR